MEMLSSLHDGGYPRITTENHSLLGCFRVGSLASTSTFISPIAIILLLYEHSWWLFRPWLAGTVLSLGIHTTLDFSSVMPKGRSCNTPHNASDWPGRPGSERARSQRKPKSQPLGANEPFVPICGKGSVDAACGKLLFCGKNSVNAACGVLFFFFFK